MNMKIWLQLAFLFRLSFSVELNENFQRYFCQSSDWAPNTSNFIVTKSLVQCAALCNQNCVAFAKRLSNGVMECALLDYDQIPITSISCSDINPQDVTIYKKESFTPITTTTTITKITTTTTSSTVTCGTVWVNNKYKCGCGLEASYSTRFVFN